MNLHVFKYYYLNLRSLTSLYEHYYLFMFLGLFILPWLTQKVAIGLIGDFLTYLSFLVLIKDKLENERNIAEIREKIKNEINEESAEIHHFLISLQINHSIEHITDTVIKDLDLIRDYRYFNENRAHFLTQMIKGCLSSDYNDNNLYAITYLFFNDIKTSYRAKFFSNNFDKKKAYDTKSKEYYLLQVLDTQGRLNQKQLPDKNLLQILSKERISQLISVELGESVTKENIDTIIADSNKYKRIKDLIIIGLNQGLISDRAIDSIIKNNNKLFFVIKYGEGTSLEDWPASEKAPFALRLKENKFEQPFFNEHYTFIRDLKAHPIETDPRSFIKNLLAQHKEFYINLKEKYPDSVAIQTGPHYGLFGFIADKSTFTWELSETRDFNSFLNKILIDEVILGEFGQDFIQANYAKIRKIVENMEWYSLISNENVIDDIKIKTNEINDDFETHGITLKTITDFKNLSSKEREKLFKSVFKHIGRKKYSNAKNKKERETYMKTALTKAYNAAQEYIAALNEL